jgi:hypothetical protein
MLLYYNYYIYCDPLSIQAAEGARQRALQEKRGANSGEGLNNTLPLWTKHGSGKDSFQGFDPETRRKILAENSELAAYRKCVG